jgi:hypothetical protein
MYILTFTKVRYLLINKITISFRWSDFSPWPVCTWTLGQVFNIYNFLVYVFFPQKKKGCTPKFTSFWRGPFNILGKLSEVLYEIDCGRNNEPQIIHLYSYVHTNIYKSNISTYKQNHHIFPVIWFFAVACLYLNLGPSGLFKLAWKIAGGGAELFVLD